MQRTPLYLFLEKMAQGEEGVAPKLCQQLADRLIYVPILPGSSGGSGGSMTVQVVRTDEQDQQRVPVFTTEKPYKAWAAGRSDKTKFISLLGGDFCAALSGHTSVVIDPGAVHSVVLSPTLVKQVSTSIPEEQGGAAGALPAPEANIPENLRGRSEPTSYMARPKPQSGAFDAPGGKGGGLFAGAFAAGTDEPNSGNEEEPGVGDTLTKPVQALKKPVIFSPDSDSNRVVREKEDPTKKKRRSLLSFLKGS